MQTGGAVLGRAAGSQLDRDLSHDRAVLPQRVHIILNAVQLDGYIFAHNGVAFALMSFSAAIYIGAVFFIAAGHLDADITADMCVVSAAVDMAKAVSIFDLDADVSEHLCVVHVITVTGSAAVYCSVVVGHIIGYGYDGHIAAHCSCMLI